MKQRIQYTNIRDGIAIGRPASIREIHTNRYVETLPVIRILQSVGIFETATAVYRPAWS